MPLPVLDFWFDFASTYSYLAAMRIGPLAQKAEVRVRFRPFLLGPIFKAQGWSTSPFNLYPSKGRHMWRDLERSCAELQLAFRRPDPFPQNSLLAARVALVGLDQPLGEGRRQTRLRIEPHGQAGTGHVPLGLADAVLAEVEDRGCEHCRGVAVADAFDQVLQRAHPARGDHRHGHCIGDGAGERDVE